MRVESEAAPCRRVTRRTVAFGVTSDARLETLPRGLPVPEAESAERIVIPRPPEPRARDESGLLVTTLAELRVVVAIAAVAVPGVGGARVPRDEPPRVEARRPAAVGSMAFQARRSEVTRLARGGPRVGLRPVTVAKRRRMTRRRRAHRSSTGRAPVPALRQ